jgi:hypothetical protein
VKLQNSGQLRTSCDRFPLYDKAGGRTILRAGRAPRQGTDAVYRGREVTLWFIAAGVALAIVLLHLLIWALFTGRL